MKFTEVDVHKLPDGSVECICVNLDTVTMVEALLHSGESKSRIVFTNGTTQRTLHTYVELRGLINRAMGGY